MLSKIPISLLKNKLSRDILSKIVFHYVRIRRRILSMSTIPGLQDLTTIHQCEDYIAIDKHYDVKINDNDPEVKVTVANQLKEKYPHLADEKLCHHFRWVHRLDYATSGVLCVPLSKKAARDAGISFQSRIVKKYYLALVRGHLCEEQVCVDKPVGVRNELGLTHMMCTDETPSCGDKREAKTRLTVLERGEYDSEPASKLLLEPFTGRRHQLRVHCHHIGHPIVGDFTYSEGKDLSPYRMMLHAYRLILPLPNKTMDFTAPDKFLPEIDDKWKPSQIINNVSSLLESDDH